MDLNKVVEEGDFSWSDFVSVGGSNFFHIRRLEENIPFGKGFYKAAPKFSGATQMDRNKVTEEGWFLLRFAKTQTTNGDIVHTLRAGDVSDAAQWDALESAEGAILYAYKHGKVWPGAEWSNPNA
jgi:hypothetical protein